MSPPRLISVPRWAEDRMIENCDRDGMVRACEAIARVAIRGLYAPGLERVDLLQEARFGVAKAVRDFDPGFGNFQAFALMCARRQAFSAVKAATRNKHSSLNGSVDIEDVGDGDRPLSEMLPGGVDPAVIFEQRETAFRLLGVVASDLSDIERSALMAVDGVGGTSYDALAATLGVKVKTIDNARQRARKKLALVA